MYLLLIAALNTSLPILPKPYKPKLNLENSSVSDSKSDLISNKKNYLSGKVIKLSDDELRLHKKYIKFNLPKNNFN